MSIRHLLSDGTNDQEQYSHHPRFESDSNSGRRKVNDSYMEDNGEMDDSYSSQRKVKHEDTTVYSPPMTSSDQVPRTVTSVAGIKRKKQDLTSTTTGLLDAPKKKRRSKKQLLAEAALAEANGESLPEMDDKKKKKRTKKIQDPDHLSPAGFRHGGERVVQEPEELVDLDPDVGPTSLLDVESPPMVYWKGHPLSVEGKPGCERLHPHEAFIASTLRLSPAQYLNCKKTLILASRQYFANRDGKAFRKSDAQKLCRIDVNKTSRLWEVFARIGWLEGISEKDL